MSSDLHDRQIPRIIFSSLLKTAVRASFPEVCFMGIHLTYLAPSSKLGRKE